MMKIPTQQAQIDLQTIETPIGTLVVCATLQGICLVEFADIQGLEKEYAKLAKEKQAVIKEQDNPHITQFKQELEAYFTKTRTNFTVALDIVGTVFQQQVWQGLLSIPYGETKSYKQQSDFLNIPKSIRAVANANGQNRIAIVIPCHRIIGADGSLTGYKGGLWRKQKLLELENIAYSKETQLSLFVD